MSHTESAKKDTSVYFQILFKKNVGRPEVNTPSTLSTSSDFTFFRFSRTLRVQKICTSEVDDEDSASHLLRTKHIFDRKLENVTMACDAIIERFAVVSSTKNPPDGKRYKNRRLDKRFAIIDITPTVHCWTYEMTSVSFRKRVVCMNKLCKRCLLMLLLLQSIKLFG